MSIFLLAADSSVTDSSRLLQQYIVYGIIIVAGIIILSFIKYASRLPKHSELKDRLKSFLDAFDKVAKEENEKSYDKIKTAAELLYRLDKLIAVTATMAQKERDSDLDSLSVMLESARNELSAYKTSKCEEKYRLLAVRAKVANGLALLDKIIERDATLKKSRYGQ